MTVRGKDLRRSLRELEDRDPAVADARRRLDEMTTPHEIWRRRMVADIWGRPAP